MGTADDPKPGPDRSFDWSAVDDNLYDGAPDSGARQIGYGATEEAAVADLLSQLEETA